MIKIQDDRGDKCVDDRSLPLKKAYFLLDILLLSFIIRATQEKNLTKSIEDIKTAYGNSRG